VLHVSRAVLARRRAHRDELECAVRDRGVLIGRPITSAPDPVAALAAINASLLAAA